MPTPIEDSAVTLDGVTLERGGRVVLSNISFQIETGAFVGLLGPNGSGKTTLLRALLGLETPRSGTLRVLGEPVRRGRADIGYMPQAGSQPVARLSGWDYVASALKGAAWGPPLRGATARREVDRALDLVGAASLARRPLVALSGGERQRLILAQALLGRPRLLLLDEPLISLDPSRQAAVIELVSDLRAALGFTVLFSAHELNPLLGALTKVLYLGNGAAALGTVDEVITAPTLSRLYGSPIEVVRLGGRIFVLSGRHEMQAAGQCVAGGHAHGPHDSGEHTHVRV